MPFRFLDTASHGMLHRLEAERRERRMQMQVRLAGGLAPRPQPLQTRLISRLRKARSTPVIRGEHPLTSPVIHTGGTQF